MMLSQILCDRWYHSHTCLNVGRGSERCTSGSVMEFKPVLQKRHEIESDVNTSNSKQLLRQQYANCCQVGGVYYNNWIELYGPQKTIE